jgi:hypothetical protein
MIELGRLDEFGAAAVENCETLKSYEVVSTATELKDVMDHVRDWPLLVVVIPSVKGDDIGRDNRAERNTAMFFVLKPMRESMTREQRMDLWKETQQGMKELKEYIDEQRCSDFNDMFRDMDFGNRAQEPEYNLIDCSGWSLVFDFVTDWL